jgi:maltose O-acetyltransferase
MIILFDIKKYFFLFIYTFGLKHFPNSSNPFFGTISKNLRYLCCRQIFKSCGKNVNIERKASFGNGFELEIGDNSGLGRFCHVPSNIKIGNDVMMAPNVFILDLNHEFDNLEVPMWKQGVRNAPRTIIEDDVWIGRQVILTPGRTIKKGCIIAVGCVLTKDFPAYSIIGGNPSRIIKNRI